MSPRHGQSDVKEGNRNVGYYENRNQNAQWLKSADHVSAESGNTDKKVKQRNNMNPA